MPLEHPGTLECFAPAKVNLYLHITGHLPNGYHTLDTLVAFADFGDHLKIEEADAFSFSIDGPFAPALSLHDDNNLVIRAVNALARAADKKPDFRITLTKNLPVAAGIGGGSADAAAAIKGLIEWWALPEDAPYIPEVLLSLGADTPICFYGRSARILGIGEIIDTALQLPSLPVLLVNPMKTCATPDIFKAYDASVKAPKALLSLPDNLIDYPALLSFLAAQDNDLNEAATAHILEITEIISTLKKQQGCALARLSGSGATCFGIFETPKQAQNAKKSLLKNNPGWWIQNGMLRDNTVTGSYPSHISSSRQIKP